MRELAEGCERPLDVGAEVVEPLPLGVPAGSRLPRQLELHPNRGQLLLHAVVQVALDPTALGVADHDDPCARLSKISNGRLQPGSGRSLCGANSPYALLQMTALRSAQH